MALAHLFYAGNGTVPFDGTVPADSGLSRVGVIHGVAPNGNLLWYRYQGNGEADRSGSLGWDPRSSNPIGNGWNTFLHLLGGGDGVILGVHQNGDLLWYRYDGDATADPSGTRGWDANSGNPIGNGWQSFRHVFVTPQEGSPWTSRLTVYGVTQEGDLRWYAYSGNGEADRSGVLGWHANSGNVIGNGWNNFLHLFGSGGAIFGVHESGDLLWYRYEGNGEADRSGSLGWHANSSNPIGNGWQGMRDVFGGATDVGGFGHVVYAVEQNGDLRWYRYNGRGEADRSGSLGWDANSSNPIGNGW